MPEILMYGEVGWDITDRGVAEELQAADGADVTLRINSPGGDVWSGRAIMNGLRKYPGTVTAVVEGIAASAASFIAVGGADWVIMRPGTQLMIHDALSFRGGNAAEQRDEATKLDRESDAIAAVYAGKAGGDPDEWRARMVEETWYSADEAVDAGLADAVEDARQAAEPAPVDALGRGRVMALFRYRSRADAPDPDMNRPSGPERKESHVDALMKKEIRNAIREILNEEVTLTSTIDITYPEGTTVVPTGSVTVEPGGGEPTPPGLVFAVGEAPEGWSAEVEEATGVLTVTTPAGAEPDEEVTVTVTVTGNDEPVELPVTITVKSASGDDEEAPATDPATAPAGPEMVTVPADTLAALQVAAKYGWAAKEQAEDSALVAEVDGFIRDGQAVAANRQKIIDAARKNPQVLADYRQVPKNLIPVREIGHGRDPETAEESVSTDLRSRAARSNLFPKPRV